MATIRRKKSESFAILSSPGPWPQVLINWLATLAVIIVFGLIMLFSASYTTGYLRMGDSFYYIKSQVFCLGLGLAVMLLFSRIDHRFLRRMVGPGYVVCIVMLIAVLFSAPLNGCRRWLRIGFTIQVSEIAKFEMILLTAHLAAKAPHLEKLDPASGRRVPAGQWLYQRIVRELIVPLLPLIPVVFLLMLEPHMSGIVLTTAICGTILLLGGSGLFLLVFQHSLLVISGGFSLGKGDGTGGASGQAVAKAVTVVVPHQLGLSVHHTDGPLMAGSSTSTAADTSSSIHSQIRISLRNRNCISIRNPTCVYRNETTCLDNLIISITVYHQVANNGESGRTPRFYGDYVSVVEFTHVQLASGNAGVGPVGVSVDIERTHTADTFAAIVIEYYRLFAFVNQLLVEQVEHFEERAVGRYTIKFIFLKSTFFFGTFLAPNFECYIYCFFHNFIVLYRN